MAKPNYAFDKRQKELAKKKKKEEKRLQKSGADVNKIHDAEPPSSDADNALPDAGN